MEATGRKASSDAKTEEGNVREAPKVVGGGAADEDLDSGAALTGISVSTKMTGEGKGKRFHEKKHWWFLRDAYMVLQLHEERRYEHEDADETCPKASSSL